MRCEQWCSPRDQVLVSRLLVLDHEVLVLVSNIWSCSWSRSWRKSLAVFKTLVVILDGSKQGTPWHFVRQQKQFAIRKPLLDRTFCAPCTSATVEMVFNNGGYLLGHTDASKAQCGKLLSLDSNKPGKQTVHGLKCHLLEKCHKNIYTLYMRKVESRQGSPAKRRNWTRYWRRIVGWLGDWMYWNEKNTNIIRWLSLSFFGRKWISVFMSFSAVNGISFSSAFSFTTKMKMLFGRLLVYITKRFWSWSWYWDAKSWSWSWTLGWTGGRICHNNIALCMLRVLYWGAIKTELNVFLGECDMNCEQ